MAQETQGNLKSSFETRTKIQLINNFNLFDEKKTYLGLFPSLIVKIYDLCYKYIYSQYSLESKLIKSLY